MNLTMILSNDDNKINLLWGILDDCDFFSDELSGKSIIMNEKFFEKIPIKNKSRRHIIISENLEEKDSNILIFKNYINLLKRLKLTKEEFYIICDKEMFDYFSPYINKHYLIEFKNIENEISFNNDELSSDVVYEGETYKILEYRKKM